MSLYGIAIGIGVVVGIELIHRFKKVSNVRYTNRRLSPYVCKNRKIGCTIKPLNLDY